jgi:parallel beta-helix repeat protein
MVLALLSPICHSASDYDASIAVIENNGEVYTPHAPIRINSNADFDAAHGIVNWATGNGTVWNPWIIEGWDINGTGYGYCLFIGNTTNHFVVYNCYLHEASGGGRWWEYRKNNGLHFLNVINSRVDNNTISGCDRDGIALFDSNINIIIKNNVSSGIEGCDVNLSNSNNNCISNHDMQFIRFRDSNSNTMEFNTNVNFWFEFSNFNNISNNTNVCIDLFYSNGNNLFNNTFTLDHSYGIYLYFSSNNYIHDNIVSNHSNEGIILINSHNNSVYRNIIFNNEIGIIVVGDYNYIYHNTLIDNTIQASDDTVSINYWDDGYPSGGNYWSDYSGLDNFSGPAQDIPGSDGIGDTPYVIDVDSQDDYPLMVPVGGIQFDISLQQGWNLISLPLEQSNDSISSVLTSINGKLDCVQYYDAFGHSWRSYNIYRQDSLNDLQYLDHTMGFWINVTELGGTTMTVSGPIPTTTSINLFAGWNLVGYPSLVNETVANALWGTGADRIKVFDPAEPYRIKEVGPTYVMKPGEGYWVHVPFDTVWIVDW